MAQTAAYLTLTSILLASCSSENIAASLRDFPRRGEYSSVHTEMGIVVKSESQNKNIDISSDDDLKSFILKEFLGNCEDGPLNINGQSFQANWKCLVGNRYRPVKISGEWTDTSLYQRVDSEVDGYPLWFDETYQLLREAG